MIAKAILLSGATLLSASAAYAYPSQPPYMAPKQLTVEQINQNYRHQLVALRSEAIATQEKDGGVLTEAHRIELQQKLDSIHAELRREVRNQNIFSVSSDGRRRQ